MIYIGTAGYSYDDWKGPFYPEDIDKADMLAFYARRFRFSEVNSSYYRIPNKYMLYNMQKKTPDDFLFAVKAFQGMTHERDDNEAYFTEFVDALTPLTEVNKLACILAQFPAGFQNSQPNREYLMRFRERLGDLPVVVEFRHRSWVSEAVFEFLRLHQFGFVSVDEPRFPNLMPPVVAACGPIGYVRFHGRNAAKWWKHKYAWERYNYLYSQEELNEWLPGVTEISAKTEKTFVSMNNHYQAQAVTNAEMFADMLAKGGMEVVVGTQ